MVQGLDWFRFMKPMSPKKVAQVFIKGLQQSTPEILVGWQSHLAVWCQRLAPWLIEHITALAAPLSRQGRSPKFRRVELTS